MAEVLITLGIIGIVAAMTLPTLVQNYKKHEVETKLAKVYSVMNSAIKTSTIENGETDTWRQLGHSSSTATYSDILGWYNEYLAKYINSAEVKQIQNTQNLVIYFPDGTALEIKNYIYDMFFYTKGNLVGSSKVQAGKNLFRFRFSPKLAPGYGSSDLEKIKYSVNPGFEPYTYAWDGTYEGAKHDSYGSTYGCFDKTRSLCTKLIQMNGWKIPEDYPLKF